MSSNYRSTRDSTRSTRNNTPSIRLNTRSTRDTTRSTRDNDRYRPLTYSEEIATNVPGLVNTSPTHRLNNRLAHQSGCSYSTSRVREPSYSDTDSSASSSDDDLPSPTLEAAAAAYKASNPSARQIHELREAGRRAEYKNDKLGRKNERIEADRARARAERDARAAAGGDGRALVARGGAGAGRERRRVVEVEIREERRIVRRRE